MINLSYEEVFLAVNQWINREKESWTKNKILNNITIDDIIIIDFDFKLCVARIVVEDIDFAPYRYVSFEALLLKNQEPIYYWYDNNNTSINEILSELDKSIQFCICLK